MSASCTTGLLQPLLRYVSVSEADRDIVPDEFWSASPGGRMYRDDAEHMILRAVERFGNERIGLTLGRTMRLGEGGAFDYAVHSASTVRESLEVAGRFSALVSDSLRIWSEPWRNQTLIRLLDEACWATPSADFSVCAFYKLHLAEILPADAQLECWFPYSTPADMAAYETGFPGARFKFNAPCYGFAFSRQHQSAPTPGADPLLHPIHCGRVASLLAQLTLPKRVTARVRAAIVHDVRARGGPSASRVAESVGLSRRTMSRRLEDEGTSYAVLLEDVRQELGTWYVGQTDASLVEIASLLGFAHAESLYRAFRRWTGDTPLAYRARVLEQKRTGKRAAAL